MEIEPVKIIFIDDNWDESDPVTIALKERYGENNVIIKRQSSEGLSCIRQHLPGKIIVLLDLDMGKNQADGYQIFDEIRRETSLVYLIIITAVNLDHVRRENLVKFINNDALAFLNKTASTEEIVEKVEKAEHQLNARIDCVMEEWISKQPEDEISKPFLASKTGETYSLKDIMLQIRQQTPLGKEIEKKILYLAIDLFARQNENSSR